MFEFLKIRTEPEKEADTIQCKEATLYRHLLRLEHTERSHHGEWKDPAREILQQWIDAIHPVLVANKHILLLSLHPFSRRSLDLLILTTPYTLDDIGLDQHIQVKKKSKKPTRFEVWVKSSCENLATMMSTTTAGPLAADYTEKNFTARSNTVNS